MIIRSESPKMKPEGAVAFFCTVADFTPKGKELFNQVCALLTTGGFQVEGGKWEGVIPANGGGFQRAAVYVLPEGEKLTENAWRRAVGTLTGWATNTKMKTLTLDFTYGWPKSLGANRFGQAIPYAVPLSSYRYTDYKSIDPPKVELKEVRYRLPKLAAKDQQAFDEGFAFGERMAQGVLLTRDLVTHPGNLATPEYVAQTAAAQAELGGFKATILDTKKLRQERMAGLLAVGGGSDSGPYLVILEKPAKSKKAPTVVLVGKGICFDSGGLCIKGCEGMWAMKDDMGGAAAVLGTMVALRDVTLPFNLIALLPLAENMPDSRAYRPGDVLRYANGKTVEIHSTDAEGRLVLADALCYAARFKPTLTVDIATLTGACVVALGGGIAGIFSQDQALLDAMIACGKVEGESLWPLPLPDEYEDMIRSDIADMKNTGGRNAGATTAALLLRHFAPEGRWLHIDIAGTAWSDRETPLGPKGATAFGTATLCRFLTDNPLGIK